MSAQNTRPLLSLENIFLKYFAFLLTNLTHLSRSFSDDAGLQNRESLFYTVSLYLESVKTPLNRLWTYIATLELDDVFSV